MTLRHRRQSSSFNNSPNEPSTVNQSDDDERDQNTQQIFDEILDQKNKKLCEQKHQHFCNKHGFIIPKDEYAVYKQRSSFWISIVSIPLFCLFLYALLHFL